MMMAANARIKSIVALHRDGLNKKNINLCVKRISSEIDSCVSKGDMELVFVLPEDIATSMDDIVIVDILESLGYECTVFDNKIKISWCW